MTMVQVMSLEQPANGWFIPYCQDQTLFFADEAIEQRKNVKIPLFVTGEETNVLNVLNNWLTKDIEDDKYQAIDQFGSAHEGNVCFIKIRSKYSSNTLVSLLRIFMKQTLSAFKFEKLNKFLFSTTKTLKSTTQLK